MCDDCICQYCGKSLSSSKCRKRHELICDKNPSIPHNNYCQYCNKLCKNTNSLRNHERKCPSNPNRVYVSYTLGRLAWNYGLTKDTDERVKKYGETYKTNIKSGETLPGFQGHHHDAITKEKISNSMKLAHQEGRASSWIGRRTLSFAENSWLHIFQNNQLEPKQNYYVKPYWLDFAWPDKQIYFEVDGKTHDTDAGKQHDEIRTKKLTELGWTLIGRCKWSEYKKMSYEQRVEYVSSIIMKIKGT